MKRCPTCDKTYDDSMKFCQNDGTTLQTVTEGGADDSLKTIVSTPTETPAQSFDSFQTIGGEPLTPEEAPDSTENEDWAKTQIISSHDTRNIFNDQIEKDFDAGATPIKSPPDFAPPTPFDTPASSWMDSDKKNADQFSSPSSPFGETKSPDYASSSTFKEPEPFNQPSFGSQESYSPPFQQTEWTPPPAPVSEWQNQNLGANTPFQTPMVAGQNQNQTLPIVSLVCGVLSFILLCCYGGVPLGIVALITGYLGIQNINTDSLNYTGKNLAIVGMIFGGVSIALSIIGLIFIGIGGILR